MYLAELMMKFKAEIGTKMQQYLIESLKCYMFYILLTIVMTVYVSLKVFHLCMRKYIELTGFYINFNLYINFLEKNANTA
jgi:hypothetical protein